MEKKAKSITLNDKEISLLDEVLSISQYDYYKNNQNKKSKLCLVILNKINNHRGEL